MDSHSCTLGPIEPPSSLLREWQFAPGARHTSSPSGSAAALLAGGVWPPPTELRRESARQAALAGSRDGHNLSLWPRRLALRGQPGCGAFSQAAAWGRCGLSGGL